MKNIAVNFWVERMENEKYAVIIRRNGVDYQVSDAKYDKVWRSNGWSIFSIANGYWNILDSNTGMELLPENVYTFIGENNYGRRLCKMGDLYAVMINYKVVSPWYDFIRFELNFNIAKLNGCEFMTSGNGCYIMSDGYKKIGRFNYFPELNKMFAEVVGSNGKVGTIDSNGDVAIPCIYEKLIPFGMVFRICEYKVSNGTSMYGIIGVNGEELTKEGYISYEVFEGKIKMTNPDGEVHIFNSIGKRVRNRNSMKN